MDYFSNLKQTRCRVTVSQKKPSIKIEKAISLVKYCQKKSSFFEVEMFIDEALLTQENGDAFWKIGDRLKPKETWHIYIEVAIHQRH